MLSFAPVVYQEMPDWMALGVPVGELAARLQDNFRFFVKESPPPAQLYRGLPGIHVAVRNPDESEEAATGSVSGHYHEVTIGETHTPDAPFIFESLTNFFKNEGLRELLDEISPIQDFTGSKMELRFGEYSFGEPKYDERECRDRDATYAVPLRVRVELIVKETGEVKEQELFMGDFPLVLHHIPFQVKQHLNCRISIWTAALQK